MQRWVQSFAALGMGCAVACISAGAAIAAPALPATYVPTDPNKVVHRLPAPVPAQERQRWVVVQSKPNAFGPTPREALALAQAAIARSRMTGHPSDLGQAAAALAAWQGDANPPREIRLMRAIVHQRQHRFSEAFNDLNALAPEGAAADAVTMQALLTRASLHRVQAQWPKAKRDCEQLASLAQKTSRPDIVVLARACMAEVLTFTGRWQSGHTALQQLAVQAPNDVGVRQLIAELELRLGATKHTLAKLEQLAQTPGDVYSKTSYLDALLDHGQPAQALKVWTAWRAPNPSGEPQALDATDPWLIQRAIVAKRLALPEATALAQLLQERHQTTLLRQESLDARDAARVALDVLDLPEQAHAHAQANWALQREPIDALLFVRTAVAAHRHDEAKQFIAQRRAEGWHDVRWSQALMARKGP
jgi:hypothetical protein